MSRAATIAGELDTMTKNLIALAIGVVHGCDGCIAPHARTAVAAGASKQQAAARADTAFCELLDAENA
jgi:AhpD family alkylhydroperoxidase